MFSFPASKHEPLNEGYDFRSVVEEFNSTPPSPLLTRRNKSGYWRLRKRNYRQFPSPSDSILQSNYNPESITSTKKLDVGGRSSSETSPFLGNGLLTPPSMSHPMTFGSNHTSASKRRKTAAHTDEYESDEIFDRSQLVRQIQLLRTSLDDEEALIWSASEDDDADSESEDRHLPHEEVHELHIRRRGWPIYR